MLITSWGHDPGVVPTSNVLTMLNDALTHSAVLIQVKTHMKELDFCTYSGERLTRGAVRISYFIMRRNVSRHSAMGQIKLWCAAAVYVTYGRHYMCV